jgi:hypothetical protein
LISITLSVIDCDNEAKAHLRIFKTKGFARFCKHDAIEDAQLKAAILAAEAGKIDANMGGEVIKQRIARPGAGKSGGYRTIIMFRKGARSIFVYGYAKSDRDNLSKQELAAFKKAAALALDFDDATVSALLKATDWMEIK